MAEAPGISEEKLLVDAGFSSGEIDQWRSDTRRTLQEGGFSTVEADEYFGVNEDHDFTEFMDSFNVNLQEDVSARAKDVTPGDKKDKVQTDFGEAEQADTFVEALEAGWDMSVSGLLDSRPDMILPDDAPLYMRMASQVSTLAGDVPTMAAGGVLGFVTGAAVGTATVPVPVAGTVGGATVGAAAGAFALPAAMRKSLMLGYENGNIKSFGDFFSRMGAVTVEALRGGATGAITVATGGAAKAATTAAPVLASSAATAATEVATMTMVGSALEGRVPEPEEFMDAGILIGGFHGMAKVGGKLRRNYSKAGIEPTDIANEVQVDAHLKQQMLAENVPVPKRVNTMAVEKGLPPVKTPKPPKTFEVTKFKEGADVGKVLEVVGEAADKGKKKISVRKAYTDFVDALDPINEATSILTKNKKNLPADKNPYILGRMAVDAKAKAKHAFERGTIDFKTLEVNGKSLKSTLEKVDSPDNLKAYMISKRAIQQSKKGFETGVDIKAAESVVKKNKAKYEKAASEVIEFQNRTLEYAADSGLLTKDAAAKIKNENTAYVPFKRIFEEVERMEQGKFKGKLGSLKKFKGSQRKIQDPIQAIVDNTLEIMQQAENNRAGVELVKLIESMEGQTLFKEVKPSLKGIKISEKELAAHLKDLGVSEADIAPLKVFRRQQKTLGPNQFEVMFEGKRRVFETTPEIAEAVKGLGGHKGSLNPALKLMRGVTTFKKFGITFTPDFIIRNAFRDSVTASAFSKSGGMTPFDLAGAMGDIFKKNENYYKWLKSGGANGAFLELDARYVSRDIIALNEKTNFMNSVRNLVLKPVDFMRVAAELTEQAPRLAEFKKITKGKDGSTVLAEGGFASREITIDFQRMGAKTAALNSITAFQNVAIQGLDRTVRAIKDNPKAVVAKSLAYITAPSIMLWYANKDDERVKEVPQWEKDLYWIMATDKWTDVEAEEAEGLPDHLVRQSGDKFQVNKGNLYRIPKPMELGIMFGSLPERLLDMYFTDNPEALKDFGKTVGEMVTPAIVPDAISPSLEQYFNKSFFTGRDIVPNHLKDILPEYQFSEYTSETAKTLGKFVAGIDRTSQAASPVVIDNYIRSWGGSLGQYAIQTADLILKKAGVAPDITKPTATLADIPFVKAFAVRFPTQGAKSIRTFYDMYGESKVITNTIKHLAKEGDIENLEKELLLPENQDKLATLDGIRSALSAQANFIRKVNKMPEMSADEKRVIIDGAYYAMIQISGTGVELMRELKKAMKEGNK